MFDSGISAKVLIDDLKAEIDIAYDIPNRSYISWVNAAEQLLYSEIIQEQRMVEFDNKSVIDLEQIPVLDNEDTIRFEDIYAVYLTDSDGPDIQLIKTTVTSGQVFNNCYFKELGNLRIRSNSNYDHLRLLYFVRPALKRVNDNDEILSGNILLPVEFIDLIRSKVRGEALKVANEDAVAAKWLNDYNILLETFKVWVQNKLPQFGM